MKDLQWQISVKKRDKFTCKVCKKTEEESIKKTGKGLHAHHVKDWENFPELRYVVENGLTVCNECHPKVEGIPVYHIQNLQEKTEENENTTE